MSDRILGGAGLALSAFYIWQATRIQESFMSDPVGPKGFPFIIGAALAIASLAIILRPDPAAHWPAAGKLLEILVAAAVMVAYGLALEDLGFVPATILASAYFSWRLGARPLEAAAAGVAISVGIYAVFHLALGLNLAVGPLGV